MDQNNGEKEIHLRDYLRIVSKRRYTVLTFFGVVFVVILIGTFSSTPVYMATTKVIIEKAQPGNIAAMNFYYVPYDPEFSETQIQLIKSTSVAEKVVKKLSLDTTYDSYLGTDDDGGFDIVGGTVKWFKDLAAVVLRVAGIRKEMPGDSEDGPQETDEGRIKIRQLSRMISGSLTVSPIKDSKMVNISYESTNPELAALIVNHVAQAYMDEILEMKMSSSSYAIQWLTTKADEERKKLEKSEQDLQEYMRANDIVTLENRIAMVPEKLSEVATKIASAETRRKEMESLYNRVRDLSGDVSSAETIPAIGSDATIQSLRQQILKAEQNITDMSKKYGQKHPAMIAAEGDLTVLREKKEQQIRRVIETIKNEYELALENEKNLRRLAAETKAETLNLSEKFIQYGALKRENETNKQMFEAIMQKIKEQGITQDIQTVDVWVVEKAEVPKSPAKPNKPRTILLGLIIGLFGGIGLAFFVEYLDNTVKTPEDAEERLGLPVLGTIQLYRDEGRIEKVALNEPGSVIVEAYKALRASILLSSAENPPKSILVTSTEPGEGKTVTSVNLAVTVAQSEYSVLLIDTDLRKSVIHKIFGIDNTKGLSTYLAGASDDNIIFRGPLKNLHIIPAGPVPPNPSELLGSSRMRTLLDDLRKKFDLVIMDSAPLLAVSDSLIVSTVADGSVIVAHAGSTTYESVKRSIRMLADVKSHVLGLVINALDARKTGYHYYNKYYNYSYSTDKDTAKSKSAPGI